MAPVRRIAPQPLRWLPVARKSGTHSGLSRTFDDPRLRTETASVVFPGILGRSEQDDARLHRECGRAEKRHRSVRAVPSPARDLRSDPAGPRERPAWVPTAAGTSHGPPSRLDAAPRVPPRPVRDPRRAPPRTRRRPDRPGLAAKSDGRSDGAGRAPPADGRTEESNETPRFFLRIDRQVVTIASNLAFTKSGIRSIKLLCPQGSVDRIDAS
jgi:hypothetical protein